jgi:RimJ/RimL family protein N-acetyltransferase
MRIAPTLIETERLLLRPPMVGDAEQVFTRYASVPDVTRYLAWRRHETLADTEAFVDFSKIEWAAMGCGPYLVLSRDSGVLLGGTGLSIQGDHAETGYVFARDAWGHGYATEVLSAMVALAKTLALTELTAQCHCDHRASVRVLEKCGFRLERRSPAAFVFPNLGPAKQDVLTYVCELPAARAITS